MHEFTRTVALDGGAATVEHLGDRVEVTVRLADRIAAALILSPDEADALGMAIARPYGLTVDDMWSISDALEGTRTTV